MSWNLLSVWSKHNKFFNESHFPYGIYLLYNFFALYSSIDILIGENTKSKCSLERKFNFRFLFQITSKADQILKC